MTAREHQLADLYVEMINTHNPDLEDRFLAEDYINHQDFVADGREANQQFWAAFFTGRMPASPVPGSRPRAGRAPAPVPASPPHRLPRLAARPRKRPRSHQPG